MPFTSKLCAMVDVSYSVHDTNDSATRMARTLVRLWRCSHCGLARRCDRVPGFLLAGLIRDRTGTLRAGAVATAAVGLRGPWCSDFWIHCREPWVRADHAPAE